MRFWDGRADLDHFKDINDSWGHEPGHGEAQGALAARVQDVLDAAMYRAKARGRGRYELSHESPVGVLGRT